MLEKVKKIIAEQAGVSPDTITLDSNFEDDLGLDSLDFVEISMGLEEEFGFEMAEEDGLGIATVADLMAYLQKKLEA